MYFEIDFDSGEALYRQLCRQIIMGIATNALREGDSLPSVRDMADEVGINMHTVNKAYSILREEGFLSVDRRRGAVVYIDDEKMRATNELRKDMEIAIARARCKRIGRDEILRLVDEICGEYDNE